MTHLLGILIESLLAVKNLDSILKNPNIDFVYFGAYDLSTELGQDGDIFSARIIEILERFSSIANDYNKKTLAIYRSAEELNILYKLGINFPIASVDTSNLYRKLSNEVGIYKSIVN